MGGAAGAIRGYEVATSRGAAQASGGIQLAVFLVRRCRFVSADECLCTAFTVYVEESEEQ